MHQPGTLSRNRAHLLPTNLPKIGGMLHDPQCASSINGECLPSGTLCWARPEANTHVVVVVVAGGRIGAARCQTRRARQRAKYWKASEPAYPRHGAERHGHGVASPPRATTACGLRSRLSTVETRPTIGSETRPSSLAQNDKLQAMRNKLRARRSASLSTYPLDVVDYVYC